MSEQSQANPSADEENRKAPMSDEERLALAAKLDRELDEFIEGLEKKRYTEGWPEDRWQEEMDKHPFFMKSVPENGELSPMAEGLAKLKYDPEENTPQELATNYKEDGNFNFKHKNYRLAILGYTEGIKVKCGDSELESSLYNNRAAAHFFLKNYRSALADSEKALTFKPDHLKALQRAAKSALIISKHEKCIEHCETYLKLKPDAEIEKLLKDAKSKKETFDRDFRKKERTLEKMKALKKELTDAIKSRGIKIYKNNDEELDLSLLEPNLPGANESIVRIENGILFWPVLILYPEYGTTDFIRNCPENVPLRSQLDQLFPAPWNEDSKYSLESVNVYFEGGDKKPYKVDLDKQLGEILVEKHYLMKSGTPAFIIVVRNSKTENKFLES